MLNLFFKNYLLFIAIIGLLASCENENNSPDTSNLHGVFVLNEGYSEGSVSFYNNIADSVIKDIYYNVNGVGIGELPQSMVVSEDRIFISVTTGSGNGYVEVVDANNFSRITEISTFSYPRELLIYGSNLFVSNGNGADENFQKKSSEIFIIDLDDLVVTDTINVGAGPEKMVVNNEKLYIANSGGWSNDDHTISVYDLLSKKITDTIDVLSCPTDMIIDNQNRLWVFCKGKPDYSTWPEIVYTDFGIPVIDLVTNEITKTLSLNNILTNGIKLIASNSAGSNIYFVSDKTYKIDLNSGSEEPVLFIDKVFNGIDVHPETGDVYCMDAENNQVEIYSPDGVKRNQFEVGVQPNSAVFR